MRSTAALFDRHRAGFTIVELVVVVALLSILSAVAIGRFVKPSAFAPKIVAFSIVEQVRRAQQLAANRRDATVRLTLAGAENGWRFELTTDVDGLIGTEEVTRANTVITAESGSASAMLDEAATLTLDFHPTGDLQSVDIAGGAGDPDLGVSITVAGDSERSVCVYPTGYANDEVCQ